MISTSNTVLILLIAISTSSCALFKIGSTSSGPEIVELSQRSSVSVIRLWKAELDSNNLRAAAELMVHSSGRQLLAVEKYELADDLQRWEKAVDFPITGAQVDTTSDSEHSVTIVLDYYRKLYFNTKRQNNLWFISRVKQ
ncbi:MAG: hypothetical protein HQ472_09345 [Ignavibacteria bacterium]|nr:hypothetical protein [Ignavibacteria bacterium]